MRSTVTVSPAIRHPLQGAGLVSDELLVKAFLKVIAEEWPRKQLTTLLHGFAQVCSTWARVVKSNPRLWAFISSEDAGYRLALQRAVGVPLKVYVDSFRTGNVDLFNGIAQRAQQWRFLSVDSGHDWVRIRDLFGHVGECLPSLEHLSIKIPAANRDPHCRPITLPNTPLLQRLKVEGVTVTWRSLRLPRVLVNLEVERATLNDEAWVALINTIRSSCATLERLKLGYVKTFGQESPFKGRTWWARISYPRVFVVEHYEVTRAVQVDVVKAMDMLKFGTRHGEYVWPAGCPCCCASMRTSGQDVSDQYNFGTYSTSRPSSGVAGH